MHLAPPPPQSLLALHAPWIEASEALETGDASEASATTAASVETTDTSETTGASEAGNASEVADESTTVVAWRTSWAYDASDALIDASGAELALPSGRVESTVDVPSPAGSASLPAPLPASLPRLFAGTHWVWPPASLQM